MALVEINPVVYGDCQGWRTAGTSIAQTIDADGEKVAWMGPVVYPGADAHKHITKVWVYFGAVTKVGTDLLMSLQNVDLTTGPPMIPDGTADQHAHIARADITANTWFQSGAMNATREVARGELLAVVVEQDGAFTAGDSFVFRGATDLAAAVVVDLTCCTAVYSSAAWATSRYPIIVLEFDDSTFGTLGGSMPFPASTTGWDSADDPAERGLQFQLPFPAKICGARFLVKPGTDAPFDVVLYSGTTVLASASVDEDATVTTTTVREGSVFWTPVTLTAATTYYITIKPTSGTATVVLYYWTVGAAGHWQAFPGGAEWYWATTNDTGDNWLTTTTQRAAILPILSALDDGASAGGGGIVSTALTGGRQL
jgi:hypothetical protein